MGRWFLFLVVCGLLWSCGASPLGGVEGVARFLDQDDPARNRLGAVEVLSVHELRGPGGFGGISGMSYDGTMVTAVNDSGRWLRFPMAVDAIGRPVAFGLLQQGGLGGADGSKDHGDAEELVRVPGGWLVSFEREHRLMLYGDDLSAAPHGQSVPEGFARQPANGGVEAMTVLSDGRLLLLSEDGVDGGGHGLAWIGQPGKWRRLAFARNADFQPTAVAQMPGGDVLLLERRFDVLSGVAIRLSRIALDDLRPGGAIQGRELFILAPPLLVDNYEAMAVRVRSDGRVVVYLVADDNFNPLQKTLLMSIVID